MKEKKERLLRLWKIRQEQEGYDVSGVKTLEEAEHFFDKKEESTNVKALADMTNKELVELGKEYGLDLKANVKKEKLVAAIEEASNNIATAEEPSEEVVEIPEITEEEVQAVATAIEEEAAENDKPVEVVVNEIIEESKEETPVVEGE